MNRIQKMQQNLRVWTLLVSLSLPFLGFGQAFKGKALPATINTAYDELVPRLSPDDQTLYFVRYQHPENVGGRAGGQDIWISQSDGQGNWSKAINAGPVLNNQFHNFVGAVVDDGQTLLLGNTYNSDPNVVSPGIARSKRSAASWLQPETVLSGSTLTGNSRYLDFYATADGQILILSLQNLITGKEDLAVCFAQGNGFYSPPQPLGDIINTEKGFETGPFLAADTKTLFFTSDGHGGQGNADIFVSTRLDDSWSNWTEPVNLGPEVNTTGFDGHFIMDSKGKMGYFVSGPSPTALGDIYQIPIAEIAVLKRESVVDTLRIVAKAGQPQELDLGAYGFNASNMRFVSTRALDGPGMIIPEENGPKMTYRPAGVYQGTEHIVVEVCDPPQSDNCRKLVVEARVGDDFMPVVETFSYRIPKNSELAVDLDLKNYSIAETRRNYNLQSYSTGELNFPASVSPILNYTAGKDFVGRDSIKIYGICPNGETSNCLRAIILVDVFDMPSNVAVVDTPKVVVAVVDTPKVVVAVVDTPKVVVAVVDTPKVIVTVVDTPKVVVAVVDTPKVVVAVVDTPKVVVAVDLPITKEIIVSGLVTDLNTHQPIGAEINAFDNGKLIATVASNPLDGSYRMTLPSGRIYQIEAKQPYYFDLTDELNLMGKVNVKGQVQKNLEMTPIPMVAGQTFVLKNIYFDLDKSTLKPESKEELSRLYELLRNYPTMEIQVNGHTDSQASDDYNQALSESRAAAVVNYLKYKGVMGYRISSKGFGEKVPVATNETEDGRALNRRVEFTILKM
jgi:outer membrane protein OmpA-like peptidoglycan-associated protein